MPFKREAYTEGGVKGVTEFIGRLEDIDEEVDGQFGPQDEWHYHNVEVVESEEDVTLDEGRYTAWTKHSTRKNSVSGRNAFMWMDFAEQHGLEPDDSEDSPLQQIASAFKDKRIRFRRTTHDFGKDMSPGSSFVPVELMAGKKAAPKKAVTSEKPEPKGDIPDEITEAIIAAVGEDGATRDVIRREVVKKAALRTALGKAGGLDTVLAKLVEGSVLYEDEGLYSTTPF